MALMLRHKPNNKKGVIDIQSIISLNDVKTDELSKGIKDCRNNYTSQTGSFQIYDYMLLTPSDIGALMNFGYKKALEVMKSSGFPSIKIGNQYRVSGKDYKKWVDQNSGKRVAI